MELLNSINCPLSRLQQAEQTFTHIRKMLVLPKCIQSTLESVKDTDKFRLDCWGTERGRLLIPVLENNNNDVVSYVAFSLHLMGKT